MKIVGNTWGDKKELGQYDNEVLLNNLKDIGDIYYTRNHKILVIDIIGNNLIVELYKNNLNEEIENIYDLCNVIENVDDTDILDIISEEYPTITRENEVTIYAFVCSMLFGGETANDIIKQIL